MVTEKAMAMFWRLSVRIGIFSLALTGGGLAVFAQDNWGAKMFDRQTVEFGSVAKGADCKLRLKVRNIYQETIQIASVNTSCACFRAAVVDNVTQIPSGQSAEIEISVNTVNYQKKRDATLIVNLYEPTKASTAEVRLPLHAYIRTDVVFTPGAVNFGTVNLGSGAKQLVKVAYAGRSDWQIRGVKSPDEHVTAEVKETSRGNGLVNYDLIVELKPGTPAGALRDQLTLITDDANSPQVPLLVYGSVETDVTVEPHVLVFGELSPGETKTRPLLVRSRRPIIIEKIEREKADDSFRVRLPEDAKTIHVMPITLIAPNEAGAFDEVFTITIAGRAEPLTVRAQGKITPPASAPNAN
jgi:hypothetical protein